MMHRSGGNAVHSPATAAMAHPTESQPHRLLSAEAGPGTQPHYTPTQGAGHGDGRRPAVPANRTNNRDH